MREKSTRCIVCTKLNVAHTIHRVNSKADHHDGRLNDGDIEVNRDATIKLFKTNQLIITPRMIMYKRIAKIAL